MASHQIRNSIPFHHGPTTITPEHGIAWLCMPCNLPCCRRPCSHAPMRTARRCRPTKRRRRSRKRPRWPRWRRRRRQRRKGVRNEKASELSRKRPFFAVFRSDPASQLAARSCQPGRGMLSCKPQGDTDSGRICPWSIDGAVDGPGPFDGGGRIAPSGAPSGCRGRRPGPQPRAAPSERPSPAGHQAGGAMPSGPGRAAACAHWERPAVPRI